MTRFGRMTFRSTHAPARGATSESRSTDRVSIHAPARGATWRCDQPWTARRSTLAFQSTRPRGARHVEPASRVMRIQFHRSSRSPPQVSTRGGSTTQGRAYAGRGGGGLCVPLSTRGATGEASTNLRSVIWPGAVVDLTASTRPARGAPGSVLVLFWTDRVSIQRARAGREAAAQLFWPNLPRLKSGVSIHAPARGALGPALVQVAPAACSVRLRGARDSIRASCPPTMPVPAPARHLDNPRSILTTVRVSIHAPARGATAVPAGPAATGRFNPRARAGRDELPMRWWRGLQFQSTRPRGARLGCTRRPDGLSMFQSTRPRGARRSAVRSTDREVGRFNPRARAGRDMDGEPVRPVRFNPRARAGRDTG